jgi:hypothetical protein
MKAKFLILVFIAAFVRQIPAQDLKQVMDPATYERSGLSKLSDDERAVIEKFFHDYVAGKQQQAASAAVDVAVKERRVRPPDVVQSKIVGSFTGYGPRTVFHLENGETWKPTNDDVEHYSTIDDPPVVIYRDAFGYKMFIEGASMVRVKRVQ